MFKLIKKKRCLDDERATAATWDDVKHVKPYLLFYSKSAPNYTSHSPPPPPTPSPETSNAPADDRADSDDDDMATAADTGCDSQDSDDDVTVA